MARGWPTGRSSCADRPATLARDHCAVAALFQFARVPYAVPRDDGWLVGDLRYDREPGLGIAEIEVGPAADECPTPAVPWVPPRQDLPDGG